MPLPSSGSGSGTSPITGLVGPTTSGGAGTAGTGYLSQTGIDLNVVGTMTETLVLSNHTIAAAQLTEETGSVSAVICSLQGSIDGVLWTDTGKTISAAGITTEQDVRVYKLLRVIVTTANGAALIARISIVAKTV